MKKLLLVLMLSVSLLASAQQTGSRNVKMPTESNLGTNQKDYAELSAGFFCVGQVSTAYTLNDKPGKFGFSDLAGIAGYRFNDYFRAGVGIGVRYYYNVGDIRRMSHKFGMPLFLDLRGNFIPNDYRDVVPFWSVDLGATFPDGVMFRPSIGVRVGQPRSAFVASLGYVGQKIRCYQGIKDDFTSGISLTLGYEF